MPTLSDMNPPDQFLVKKAADALKGSVKLSNEIIGIMSLIEAGMRPTPGIIKAMRGYIKSATIFVDEIE